MDRVITEGWLNSGNDIERYFNVWEYTSRPTVATYTATQLLTTAIGADIKVEI